MLGALGETDIAGAAIKSLSAGCDLLIYGNLSVTLESLAEQVVEQLRDNDILRAILTERQNKVRKFITKNAEILS